MSGRKADIRHCARPEIRRDDLAVVVNRQTPVKGLAQIPADLIQFGTRLGARADGFLRLLSAHAGLGGSPLIVAVLQEMRQELLCIITEGRLQIRIAVRIIHGIKNSGIIRPLNGEFGGIGRCCGLLRRGLRDGRRRIALTGTAFLLTEGNEMPVIGGQVVAEGGPQIRIACRIGMHIKCGRGLPALLHAVVDKVPQRRRLGGAGGGAGHIERLGHEGRQRHTL